MPPGLGKPMKGPISFIDGLSVLPCSYLFLRPVGIGGAPSLVVYLPGEMEAVEVAGGTRLAAHAHCGAWFGRPRCLDPKPPLEIPGTARLEV